MKDAVKENSLLLTYFIIPSIWASQQETQVRSLGWGDPLEKAMATHSSILAWKIPWTEEPGGLRSMGSQSQTRLNAHTH